jgi:hypothetical protein
VATNFVLSHSSWRLKHNRWWKDANHLINKNDEKAQFSIEATSDVPAEIVVATPVVSLDMLRDERVPVSVAIKGQFLSNPVELTITTTDLISGEKSISTIQFLAPPLSRQAEMSDSELKHCLHKAFPRVCVCDAK